MRPYFLICLFSLLSLMTHAQPGSLDASFGNGGKVLTNVDQTRNVTNSVLVQPDGKIVVVGYCRPVDYEGYFALARYNQNGTIDKDFGLDGIVTTIINGDEDIALSGTLQADGKIIAAGYSWTGMDYDFAMVRYNADGTRDMSFGSNGIVTTDFEGNNDKANQVVIAPDGSIFLVGFAGNGNYLQMDMASARYDTNGSPMLTFGTNGKSIVAVSEDLRDAARGAVLQDDGKLIIVGSAAIGGVLDEYVNEVIVVLRLNTNGSLDSSFGDLGIVKRSIGKIDIGTSITLQENGQIVVLAESISVEYNGYSDFAVLRLDHNGNLDNSFGINGASIFSFDNTNDTGYALCLQPDQKILAAGYTAVNNGSTVDFALARFNPNGTLDNTFGNGGKVTVDFQGGLDFGASIALQKDGKIVMAGAARVGNDFDFGLVRFENDIALPVKLIRFDATRQEKQVHLKWQTSEEMNSNYFEIQKSPDGIKWAAIGTVGAAENSVIGREYYFVDENPQPGQNYYRLKMVDKDESFAFSSVKVILLDLMSAKNELVVYPNPVKGKLYVSLGKSETLQLVQLYHLNGVLAFQSESHSPEIALPDLEAGQYCLILQLADGSTKSQTIFISR
ncbi:hypothetical protein LZD49_01745 [Dyadobacter sp. CY261]|uniref:hypothetical protein n=1 Tax=Dyadobacter sp. CY261 TaxID=2907203 RepID=UPI001F266232|nr:hypothetical protein [Dyadobacter sp. CY261]MCF0069175.1 hypothetical protein [Dyadobacter sp. CY261]